MMNTQMSLREPRILIQPPRRRILARKRLAFLTATHSPPASEQLERPMTDRDYCVALAERFRPLHLWVKGDAAWRPRHTAWGDNR